MSACRSLSLPTLIALTLAAFASMAAAAQSLPRNGLRDQERDTIVEPTSLPRTPHPSVTYGFSPVSNNFGTQNVSTATTAQFTVTLPSGKITPKVVTQGATGLDFTDAGTGSCNTTTTYSSGQTCTIVVQFKPTRPGLRLGAVEVLNSTGTSVLYSAFLSGNGSGALLRYDANSTVVPTPVTFTNASSVPGSNAITVDAAGNLWYTTGGYAAYPSGSSPALKVLNATGGSLSAGASVTTLASGFGTFNSPQGVAVDGFGNVWVLDTGISPYEGTKTNGKLVEFQVIGTTVTGTATFTFAPSNPGYYGGIAFDPSGNLFVAYSNAQSSGFIGKYAATNGSIASGTTMQTVATETGPYGVAVDAVGNVFFVDTAAAYKIPSGSSQATQVASGLGAVTGIAVEADDSLLILNSADYVYLVPYTGGAYGSTVTVYHEPSAYQGDLFDIATDLQGNIYVGEGFDGSQNLRIREFVLNTPPVLTFAQTSVGNTSATQTVSLENAGNAALTVPQPQSGQDPSMSNYFTLGGNCPLAYSSSSSAGTLATGAVCSTTLAYAPTISGAVTGNLIYTDNNLGVTGSAQRIVMTGTTSSGLTIDVPNQSIAYGTSTTSLTFIIGWGGNTAPTANATVTVNNSSTGVATSVCTVKAGHENCTFGYTSSLNPGSYPITVTVPANGTYSSTSATGTLTVTPQ